MSDAAPLPAQTDHRSTLLAAGRCDRCAERVPRFEIIRDTDCPHCGGELGVRDAVRPNAGRHALRMSLNKLEFLQS